MLGSGFAANDAGGVMVGIAGRCLRTTCRGIRMNVSRELYRGIMMPRYVGGYLPLCNETIHARERERE
jgi:hypothetical protein